MSESTAERESAEEWRSEPATAVFGALMLVASVLVIVDAARLPDTGDAVGPAAVPLPVGILLGVVGAVLAVRALTRLGKAGEGVPWQRGAIVRVLLLVATLVAFAFLLPLLGYVVSSAALFTSAAFLLGAPLRWNIPLTGWTLAAILFVVFDRLIGLTLPSGPWGF